MKKIKITEAQAKLLGINKINEDEESNIGSASVAIGDLIVRVVIEGPTVAKFKERIIHLILRQDPTSNVAYFEATGKIVGNVKEIRLQSIARDLKALDPSIEIKKKAPNKSLKEGEVKNIVKITKEQYNRIFASGLINESDNVNGGLNRVDKEFKKQLSQADIKENAEDPFKNEVEGLVKYLYRKEDKLSPFWKNNGLSYDAICDTLLSKGLIISKDGRYELSRSLGSPEAAMQAVSDQLRTLVPAQKDSAPVEKTEPVEVDEDNYPAGAKDDSRAPYNQKDAVMSEPEKAKKIVFTPVAYNGEIIIMKDPQGELYAFYHWALDKNDWLPYASVERSYVGKDEDGQPDYDYDFDSAEKDAEVITHYVNDNLDKVTKGEGIEAWENGVDLVKIDEPLKKELLSMFDKDPNIIKALGGIQEVSFDDAKQSFKNNVAQAYTEKPETGEAPDAKQNRIVAKLQQLRQQEIERKEREKAEIAARQASVDEMTGTASSGAFVAPMAIDKNLDETLTVAGAGNFQYDTPGGLTMDLGKHNPKTKAEKTPQWAGGEFVEQPECSKSNNNKEAQNGGCNSGASSLRTKKVKGSINAPSLGENAIYETIAKKTGKTVDEVKAIIESKKGKA